MTREKEKACEGGRTLEDWSCDGDMRECLHCGRAVRWDLTDHPFFGWQNCSEKREHKAEAMILAQWRRTHD